jgi:hypothetical protein
MSDGINPLRIQAPPEAEGNLLANQGGQPDWGSAYSSTTDAVTNWLQQQRAKSVQMGLMDPSTGWPTQAGWQNALVQYTGALMGGSSGTRGEPIAPAAPAADLIKRLVDHWGSSSEVPFNEGGQQVNMFLPDGKVSTAAIPNHQAMVSEAGIPGSLQDFMAATGAIRSHGPDNYEVHQSPTTSQLRAISRYARDNGHTSVWIDAGAGDDITSDSVPVGQLSAFFKRVFQDQGQ